MNDSTSRAPMIIAAVDGVYDETAGVHRVVGGFKAFCRVVWRAYLGLVALV